MNKLPVRRPHTTDKTFPVFPTRHGFWEDLGTERKRESWRRKLLECARDILRQHNFPAHPMK